MTRHPHEHESDDAVLDRAVQAMLDEEPDAETVRMAADRAWRRLAETLPAVLPADRAVSAAAGSAAPPAEAGQIAGCAGYRELIPALVAGELPPARRLLVEDHTRECVGCRRALLAERSGAAGRPVAAAPAAAPARAGSRRLWLPLAAAVLFAVGLAGWFLAEGLIYRGEVATVTSVDGQLFGVEGGGRGMLFLPAGMAIDAGDTVRTAKGSRATLRLGDGSLVELNERTQLRVREGFRGRTVTVDRGAVIVEAADQRPKHLWVVTDEARVQVTGTIFAVEHGVRGSRVAVVEGEVEVAHGGRELVLHPGQQTSSRTTLAATPVADQIAWSSHVDRYLALLGEIDELRREIARAIGPGTLRYDSVLAGLAPESTLVFVALPNPTHSIAESWRIFRERLATSPVLAEWWGEHGAGETGGKVDETVARLRDFGGFLGEEIVIAVPRGDQADASSGAEPGGVVVFSEVAREDAFRSHLENELARIAADEPETEAHVILVADPAEATGEDDRLYLWIGEGRFVAATSGALLRQAVAAVGAGSGGFAGTELGQAVAQSYADGTEWLFAADLASTLGAEAEDDSGLARSGIADVERIVVERWDEGERAVMSAEISFAGDRQGMASWLAAPAPIGALDFVSPDAHVVAAFAVKEPASMLDDLLAMVGNDDDSFTDLEAELGLSLRDDVAGPLGGEIVVALDGPVLPSPSWKVVLEVYDTGRFQHALATAVRRVAERQAAEGEPALTLTSETSRGRAYHRIAGRGAEVHYTLVDGYLLAAPSRALLARTLDQRAAGATLAATARFRDLLPRDARTDVSALFYQNLGPLVAPLAGGLSRLGGGGQQLSDEQRQALAALAQRSEPSLVAAYGLDDRVTFAGSGPGGPLGFGFSAVSGFSGLAALAGVLDAAADEQAAAGGS